MTAYNIDMTVFIAETKTVSISNDGYFGAFHGTCDGIAAFKTIDVPEITTSELIIESSGRDYIHSDGDELYRWDYSDQADYPVKWITSSDERIKEDIEPLDIELSRNLIDATKPKKFRYLNQQYKHYGMIAQDARELLDSLGETDAHLEYSQGDLKVEDQRAIEYEEYIPHLINYVKQLRSEIEDLKKVVERLSI